MPLTPEHNIYYPDSESQFTPLESHFAAMATSVDDAMIQQGAEFQSSVGAAQAAADAAQAAADAAHARIDPESLGTRNLDNVTAQGTYWNGSNANATAARNYPVQAAGALTVEWWGGNSNTIIQTYKAYRGAGTSLRGTFWRSTVSNGQWGGWSRLHDSDTPGVVYAEAAGSFTMGSSSNYPVGSTESRSISFPSGRFSVAPLVMVSTAGTFGSGVASAHVISSSGFRADFRRLDSQSFSTGVYMWHAIQMSSNSASG